MVEKMLPEPAFSLRIGTSTPLLKEERDYWLLLTLF